VTLVLAEDVASRDAALGTVRRWSWLLGVVTLALVAAVTTLTVRRGLRPLSRLATAIGAIDPARPGARLPAEPRPSELEAVARVLDELLARLDASVARERRFTADVSHELRTPLAGLRTLLDITARRDRSTDEYRTAVVEAAAIVVQLGVLVDDLLLLARLDAGQVPVTRAPVPLRALVADCWAPHAEAAARRGLRFDNRVADDVALDTDRDKLRVVIANLLANAAEYTEDGGWIAADAGDAILDVTDSGPPIAAADLERVFERMWRAEAARSGGVHAGIGLSLARTLCEALGFALTAATLDDGAVRFRITAPGRSASPG
jgi:signal transduction histidine kinase